MTTAVYAGSFNPFTRGHLDILCRGLMIFDRVILMLGVNVDKPAQAQTIRQRAEALGRELQPFGDRVEVVICTGLVAAEAAAHNASALLRGVRSASDYDYERSMAATNRLISGIDTVILLADPKYEAVSSSIVRELEGYGFPTDQLLPSPADIAEAASSLRKQ